MTHLAHVEHPALTEPALCAHVRDAHGWCPLRILAATYFTKLVAHAREHARTRTAVAQ